MIYSSHVITPLLRGEVSRENSRKKIMNCQLLFFPLLPNAGLPNLDLLGYQNWKSGIISEKFSNSAASYHSLSSFYLTHLTWYWTLHRWIFASKISSTFHSSWLLIITRGEISLIWLVKISVDFFKVDGDEKHVESSLIVEAATQQKLFDS